MSRPARLVGAGPDAKQPLRVLHVMRAPVGGLFRHVLDLSRAQIADGHSVGVIADSLTGGARAELELARLAEDLPLGLLRIPIHRNPHWSDLGNLRRVSGRIDELKPDVVHGHGSKGGFLARAAGRLAKTVHPVLAYTPHGGAIHFARMSLEGIAYRAIERALAPCTDVYLFESQFAAERLRAFAGASRAAGRVVVNGLHESELLPVAPAPDAADFLFIGELRALKGVCTLIEAMQVLQQRLESPPRLVMVGDGALDRELSAEIARRGLSHCISLLGCKPARKAFSLGRILVVPSHAESLPYVVLEAAGARVPIISTNVGGIPEIFGPYAGGLIRPGDVGDLANAMQAAMVAGAEALADDAERLAAFVGRKFLVTNMYDQVISGYRAGRIARESREQFKPERSESASPY
ncbi:glycosyltransferase [Rhodoblastus acidophilus]|uniref:Glycosyltransferase n=2 Tax=Rhodoblastus acidophilus TaxID=1074 RepID=A0A6N8DN81_RHOAC|nr:glycosyltransferase [Rhodoblastus acidophilus]